jgi:hypothetical protein
MLLAKFITILFCIFWIHCTCSLAEVEYFPFVKYNVRFVEVEYFSFVKCINFYDDIEHSAYVNYFVDLLNLNIFHILYVHVDYLILICWENFDKIYYLPPIDQTTPKSVQKHNNGPYCIAMVNILENIDCANFMRLRFAVDC